MTATIQPAPDSQEHAAALAAAEATSAPFRALLELLQPAAARPHTGILRFEQLKAYR